MSLWDSIQGLGAAAGGLAYAGSISDKGDAYASDMATLADTLQGDVAFTGYGVSTGLETPGQSAGVTIDPNTGATQTSFGGVGQNTALGAGASNYGAANTAMGGAVSALGGTAYNPQAGSAMLGMNAAGMGLSGMQGSALNASQQAMGNAMMDTAGREQEIYRRAMAMQQPQLNQQRAATNAAEYAAGRGGVMGSQFGGSGEDAAMARAQAQAQNNASFQAMGQAQQEMMNQANMANQFGNMGLGASGAQAAQAGQLNQMGLSNQQLAQNAYSQQGALAGQQGGMGLNAYAQSFLPLQQQMNAMQVAQQNAAMGQTGQLTGAGYGAQLGLGGIQTQVNADTAASQLYGNIVAAMMNNANQDDGGASFLGTLFGSGGLLGGS